MPRKKVFDPLTKFAIRVSERDRQIYHEVAIAERTQRDVAAEFKISPSRVNRIVHRVFRWLSDTAPVGLDEVPRPQRLYGVSRTYKEKLEYYEQRALAAFDRSEREEVVTSEFKLTPKADGSGHVAGEGKMKRSRPKPELKFLVQAQKFRQTLVEFDGFAKNGAVNTSNKDRLQEIPELLPDEEVESVIQVARQWEARRERQRAAAEGRPAPAGMSAQFNKTGAEIAQEIVDRRSSRVSNVSNRSSACSVEYHPIGSSTNGSAEVGLVRENAERNEFQEGSTKATPVGASGVASATETPSPRYAGEREGVRGEAGTNSANSNDSPRAAVGANPARVPAPAPHPNPLPGVPGRGDKDIAPQPLLGVPGRGNTEGPEPPKKVYPPAPPGFVRSEGYARPGPHMTTKEKASVHKRPFMKVNPPKLYKLNEKTNEWEAIW